MAQRFDEAGVASTEGALASLRRCKPGRAPIYRDGDLYALDPHDKEAELWVFRLDLRPRTAPLRLVRPDPEPPPSLGSSLTVANLDEAWRGGIPHNWSAQRLAVCVLDAHGKAMLPDEVVVFVTAGGRCSLLSVDSAKYWRRGAAVRVREDGWWELDAEHDALRSAREAVRDRIAFVRRPEQMRTDPAVAAAYRKQYERKREANRLALAAMRRVLLHAFPAKNPEALALIDVEQRKMATFVGDEMAQAVGELSQYELSQYDLIAGIDVRRLLRTLGFDPGGRRLGELGPPQKSKRLNKSGRTLKITTSLLIQGSCGISRPFGDEKKMLEYLLEGKVTKLRRRLEADTKSLYALYQYGRLHGSVRLRWGFLDERIPVPWVDRDEVSLYDLIARALEREVPLEVVLGSAPGWGEPWSRALRVHVEQERRWNSRLVDDEGYVIDENEIQLARLTGESRLPARDPDSDPS